MSADPIKLKLVRVLPTVILGRSKTHQELRRVPLCSTTVHRRTIQRMLTTVLPGGLAWIQIELTQQLVCSVVFKFRKGHVQGSNHAKANRESGSSPFPKLRGWHFEDCTRDGIWCVLDPHDVDNDAATPLKL